ncbi:MAG: DUF192 domain-containing protein [Candidatus Binataceae bacterium]
MALIIGSAFPVWAGAPTPRVAIVAPTGKPITAVRVEIAATPGAREFGLMYREHLDEDAGMIFLFDVPRHLTFWMKNTEIPLDMIFADGSGRIVGIIADAQPLLEKLLSVSGDSQYVLEVNGGFCTRHGVKPGDRLQFIGFSPKTAD